MLRGLPAHAACGPGLQRWTLDRGFIGAAARALEPRRQHESAFVVLLIAIERHADPRGVVAGQALHGQPGSQLTNRHSVHAIPQPGRPWIAAVRLSSGVRQPAEPRAHSATRPPSREYERSRTNATPLAVSRPQRELPASPITRLCAGAAIENPASGRFCAWCKLSTRMHQMSISGRAKHAASLDKWPKTALPRARARLLLCLHSKQSKNKCPRSGPLRVLPSALFQSLSS